MYYLSFGVKLIENIQSIQEKSDKLTQQLSKLGIAEKKLEEAIKKVNSIGEKWQHKNQTEQN